MDWVGVMGMMMADNAKNTRKQLKKAGYYKHDFIEVKMAHDGFMDHIMRWYWCRDCQKFFLKYTAYGGLMEYGAVTDQENIRNLELFRDQILNMEKE